MESEHGEESEHCSPIVPEHGPNSNPKQFILPISCDVPELIHLLINQLSRNVFDDLDTQYPPLNSPKSLNPNLTSTLKPNSFVTSLNPSHPSSSSLLHEPLQNPSLPVNNPYPLTDRKIPSHPLTEKPTRIC